MVLEMIVGHLGFDVAVSGEFKNWGEAEVSSVEENPKAAKNRESSRATLSSTDVRANESSDTPMTVHARIRLRPLTRVMVIMGSLAIDVFIEQRQRTGLRWRARFPIRNHAQR